MIFVYLYIQTEQSVMEHHWKSWKVRCVFHAAGQSGQSDEDKLIWWFEKPNFSFSKGAYSSIIYNQ